MIFISFHLINCNGDCYNDEKALLITLDYLNMDRKLIYLIVLMVLAGGISIVSLVEIALVARFNEFIFDSQTQPISEIWINSHPLIFISLKITIFMASIQMSMFVLTTLANWKELHYCKFLIYFMPICGLTNIISACRYLRGEWSYTQPMMNTATADTCKIVLKQLNVKFSNVL
jgi:hypothetical protein